MNERLLPPHGLYYVTRTADRAFLLDGDGIGTLDAVESEVLKSQLHLAGTQAGYAATGSAQVERSLAVKPGDERNLLCAPHGVYYVTLDGDRMYDLTADDRPNLSRREAGVAVGLIHHAEGWLKRLESA